MNLFLKTLPLFIASLCALGQSQTVVFSERFEDNTNQWVQLAQNDITAEVRNKEYILNRKVESGYNHFSYDLDVDFKTPFEILCSIEHTSGATEHAFGLTWAGAKLATFNQFSIAANGHFLISSRHNGGQSIYTPWTYSGAIKQERGANKLQVKYDGTQLQYYINDKLVQSTDTLPSILGSSIGFYVENIQEIRIQFITVKSTKEEIQLAEGFDSLNLTNLGNNVNTHLNEIFPLVSPNGSELYFVRKSDPKNLGPNNRNDILHSTKSNGQWGPTTRLDAPLNNAGHNVAVGITAGGNSLLLANQYDNGGQIMGPGFSMTHKTSTGWSLPENLVIEGYQNTAKDFSARLSADGTKLIMSCQTPHSKGEDLFVSFHKKGNHWGRPIPLGNVNGPKSESTPFLASDNRTLYFSSNSYPGYGSHDIYMSQRLGDEWNEWTDPKNLGSEINSPNWDHYFVIQADGTTAFVVSDKSGFGKGDIFEIKLSEEAQPAPVVMLEGRVLGANPTEFLEAEIIILKASDNSEVARMWSNPSSGNYESILSDSGRYLISAEAPGYYSYKKDISVAQIDQYEVRSLDLNMTPLKSGQKIRLDNILFVQSAVTVQAESLPELDYLVEVLKSNPEIKINIEGHTDNTGSSKLNLKLSQDRADRIKNYLIENGIAKKRLTSIGYGGQRPIVSNESTTTRQLNRRVEITIK